MFSIYDCKILSGNQFVLYMIHDTLTIIYFWNKIACTLCFNDDFARKEKDHIVFVIEL